MRRTGSLSALKVSKRVEDNVPTSRYRARCKSGPAQCPADGRRVANWRLTVRSSRGPSVGKFEPHVDWFCPSMILNFKAAWPWRRRLQRGWRRAGVTGSPTRSRTTALPCVRPVTGAGLRCSVLFMSLWLCQNHRLDTAVSGTTQVCDVRSASHAL